MFTTYMLESWDSMVDNGELFRTTHYDKNEALKAFDLLDFKAIVEIERLEKLKGGESKGKCVSWYCRKIQDFSWWRAA